MVLVLAVHTVQAPSANVPFAVILLQDHITNRKVPVDFRCRQLVPSSGATSTSLWDVSDAAALKTWLDEAINVDVAHSVFEVQEEFAIGLGEVARARASEKVTEGTKEVAQKTGRVLGAAASTVGQQAIELDHRLRLSERATAASTAIKESAVGRSTSAALGRVGVAMSAGTKKMLEHEKVNAATGAVNSSFKKLGASLSSLTGRRPSAANGEYGTGAEHTTQDGSAGYEPPTGHQPYDAPHTEAGMGGNMRNPGTAAAAAAPPAGGSGAAAERQLSGGSGGGSGAGSPTFTLDDSEGKHP